MAEHYTNVILVPEKMGMTAVSCSTCRSVAFYKHRYGVDNALLHHRRACSAPDVRVTEIMGTADEETARRAPIPE